MFSDCFVVVASCLLLGPLVVAISEHQIETQQTQETTINQVYEDLKTNVYCHKQFRKKKEHEKINEPFSDLESEFQIVDEVGERIEIKSC